MKYRMDIELLCTRMDPNMSEQKLCNHIMKGLNPTLPQHIAMLDNSTFKRSESNVLAYKKANYLLRERSGIRSDI